jgi:hypothetical protein
MTKRYLQFLAFILSAIVTTNLHAQARFAIYGTAGTEKSGLPAQAWKLGGTFGFYYGLYHIGPLDISADARGDLSHDINSGFVGPRVAVKIPVVPLKPYGEFIFGISTYSNNLPNDFAYRYVVGLDATIIPHIDWRVVDFSYGINRSGNGDHARTLTSGLVIRF